MGLNIKSFADILASRQGGVHLKPGDPVILDMTEAEVKKVFGYIPAAVSAYGVTVMIRRTGENYRVKVKLEK